MTRRYRKPYKIKRRKSIFKNRFFWLGFLALFAIEGIVYFLFFSGIFQIEKIIVSGGEKVSEESVKAFIPRENIFLIDVKEIEKNILNNFPQIGKVEIHRSFPDALNVLATERLPVALWCQEPRCFLVDNEGVIFEGSASETDLIKITGPKEILDKEKISQIMGIKEKLEDGLGVTTTQAFISTEGRLNIKTSEGWEAYFNLKGDLDWQIQELSLVLEKQISPIKRKILEYIDLRFSRVFYK